MSKKIILISFTIFTLIAFGTASSAHAFVEPISLAVALGAGFFTLVTATEGIKHTRSDRAQKQEKTTVSKPAAASNSLGLDLVTQTAFNPSK